MKKIEIGTIVTSSYFGDGYVVRTLKDVATNTYYVAVRKAIDNDIIFCRYPHCINWLFFLPPEYGKETSPAAPYLDYPDAFFDPYYPNHKYVRVELKWYERVESTKKIADFSTPNANKHSVDLQTTASTSNDPNLSCSKAMLDMINKYTSKEPEMLMEPTGKFIDLQPWHIDVTNITERTQSAQPPLTKEYDGILPPPSHDPWDMWAERFDYD